MSRKISLLVAVSTSAKVIVNNIMTWSTNSHTVRDFVSKIWKVSPRFNVVYNCLSKVKKPITVLTPKVISSQASVTPLNIEYIVSPLNIMSSIFLSVRSFGLTLLGIGRLVRTGLGTEPSLIGIVGVNSVWLRASFASFIVVHNQYKDYNV